MAKKTDLPPTQEELEQGIQKSLEELENPESDKSKQADEETKEQEAPEEKVVEAPVATTDKQIDQEVVEVKKRLVNSARENQVLYSRTKKMDEAVEEASNIDDPTDEEMSQIYPNWDQMEELAKKLARDSETNTRRFNLIHQAAKEGKNIAEWNSKVDQYVDDPKTLTDNPELEGKTEDFKIFATKPTRRGLDFDDLVKAFLYDASKKTVKNKGAMFETGSGGPNERAKPKQEKLSLAEGAALRKANYSKYIEMLMAGKIEDE